MSNPSCYRSPTRHLDTQCGDITRLIVAIKPTRHLMEAKQVLGASTVPGHPSHRVATALSPLPVWLDGQTRPSRRQYASYRMAGPISANIRTSGQHTSPACRNIPALSPPATHGSASTPQRCVKTWASAAAVQLPGVPASANGSQRTHEANTQHLNAEYLAVKPLPPPPKSAELTQVRAVPLAADTILLATPASPPDAC